MDKRFISRAINVTNLEEVEPEFVSLISPGLAVNQDVLVSFNFLMGQYHKKNDASTFDLNQLSFENKLSRRIQFFDA